MFDLFTVASFLCLLVADARHLSKIAFLVSVNEQACKR